MAQALAALMEEGTGLGDPLVVSTVGAWPEALAEALSRSYPERLERLAAARRAAAAAATLVQDIQDQARELESAKAGLEDRHRQVVDAGKPQEAAQAASHLAAAQQQPLSCSGCCRPLSKPGTGWVRSTSNCKRASTLSGPARKS